MVSFSCDECQDVVTKPKVNRHLIRCRGATLSCLDCLKTFNEQTVTGHTSCISEAEKYGPKTSQKELKSSQTFCAVCNLQLNGVVHAYQHYESKKHRAALRRSSKTAKPKPETPTLTLSENQSKNQDLVQTPTKCVGLPDTSGNTKKQNGQSNETKAKKRQKLPLKRILKQTVKNHPNKRMRKSKLVKAVRDQLGRDAPSDLATVIDKKIGKIRKLSIVGNRVVWVHPQPCSHF